MLYIHWNTYLDQWQNDSNDNAAIVLVDTNRTTTGTILWHKIGN